MAKLQSKWLVLDVTSLQNEGGNLAVKLVLADALERTANGIGVKVGGITNGHLQGNIAFAKLADSANIARLDLPQTIVGTWDFPAGANAPTIAGSELATKVYADSVASGLKSKTEAIVLADTNQTLTGVPANVDGVTTLVATDRILLNAQTNPIENGIWEVQTGAWTRPADFATGSSAQSAYIFVAQGATYADRGFTCTTNAPNDIIDTDALAWTQFSAAGSLTAGAGITIVGNVVAVNPVDLILNGSAQIDGNQLAITWTPTTYVRDVTPAEVGNIQHLTAHLAGIDNAIAAIATEHKETFVVTSTDVINKYITLSINPPSPANVKMEIGGAPNLIYGVDYQMDNVVLNRLIWSSMGIDGVISAGDNVEVYFDA